MTQYRDKLHSINILLTLLLLTLLTKKVEFWLKSWRDFNFNAYLKTEPDRNSHNLTKKFLQNGRKSGRKMAQ